ncbi:A-kinase anchor protein 13-like isoform X3 [Haliotis rufescens]|uniref:A-kinase anchor protein 13-like isoform X3 n=1 Tax=Haliotis rufescens TaxID=6454 RepID=UPI00201F1258|nr:A-kinase anchor protein 13-like isoform X3 [Haliotis rufescens]
MVETEESRMAFSPKEAPVYGGGTIVVALTEDTSFPEDAQLFLVFEGANRRHVTTASKVSVSTLHSFIPVHGVSEDVRLSVYQVHDGKTCVICLDTFHFHYDSAYHMAVFLIDSVYNIHALDDLELIKSEQFDLANEIVSTLDERLVSALKSIYLPIGWNILGDDTDDLCQDRETLLHFAARLGLRAVSLFLLEQPGGETATQIKNRHGETPAEIATEHGYQEVAELISGYNTHGMVTVDTQRIEQEHGIIQHHSSGNTSLTTFQNSSQTSVEQDIDMLQESGAGMKRGDNSEQRHFESDWPVKRDSISDGPMVACDTRMEQTIDRIFQERQAHHDMIESIVGVPMYDVSAEVDDCDDYGSTDEGVRSRPSSFIRDGSESDIQEDFTQDPQCIMEGTLNQLRGLNDGLQRYRDARVLSLRLNQDVRRDTLARFSSSCPSLDIQGRGSPLSPIDEADHHKSMLDLAQEVGPSSHLTSEASPSAFSSHHSASTDADGLGDRNIRICVNGVTVDSSTDIPDPLYMRQYVQPDFTVVDDVEGSGPGGIRRRSWCNEVVTQTRNPRETTRARMLAMTGKSMSLNSLEGDEESEEDDYQDARDNAANAGQSIRGLTAAPAAVPDAHQHKPNGSVYTEDRSLSPVNSTGSGPNVQEETNTSDYLTRTMSEPTTANPSARSLTDLPYETQQEQGGGVRDTKSRPYTVAATQGVCSCEEEYTSSLGVPHSNMTKSLSTPSIPAAAKQEMNSTDSRKLSLRRDGRGKDGKHAQFRRQDEIEEEDENVAPVRRRGGEISLQDFLSETPEKERSASFDLEDQRAKQRKEEERKKRKPSVFSRFQSSYRTKKSKDKEGKSKASTHHQFVSVSISNSTTCDVCHKPMANKPALQCENCLMYVHEHNCKDQISICDKSRRVLHREAAPQERQVAPSSGSSLRPSHSFKVRSSSAPVKTQQSLQPSTHFVPHRHSLPTPSLFGSSPTSSNASSSATHQWPFKSVEEAINEGDEIDSVGSGPDVGHSNIQDTISESMESLEATTVRTEVSIFDDNPELMLEIDEPEAWSLTVDRKTLKKMNTKDIKRQDTIWELIQTEKEYCKTLTIMQKMFSQGLLQDLNMPAEQVERLFPQMDELIEIHTTFLAQLLRLQQVKHDRSIDDVGRTLLDQFDGENVVQMKAVYGAFCSKHKEAVQLYKDLCKTDRKVQIFFKSCINHSACKRRDVPDFILGVTIRLSKYPILIEAICKSTKDKKDRDLLSRALNWSKGVLTDVNERVANYEKLVEIQSRIDSRATTVFKGKKFKRQDITLRGRKLVHTGLIGWKSARGRIVDLLAIVLTDLIFFVQESNQKYTFFVQDGKSCVIPLYKLLVREKRDTRDSHGIYLISQYSKSPEMYELVCRSKDDKEGWIKVIQMANEKCPREVEEEVPSSEMEEEKRKLEERAAKAKLIIDQLHIKDSEIKHCCDEKNKLMLELLDLYKANDEPNSRPSSMHEDASGSESLEVLQAAMHEASRLATILQGSGTHLSRSVSSVGEHVSNSFVAMPVPKRAETFAGFDSSHDVPKGGLKKRFAPQIHNMEGRSPSLLSLDKLEGDSGTSSMPESTPVDPTVSDVHRQDSIKPASPLQRSIPHVWEEQDSRGSDRSSDKGSLGELSASSISSLPPSQGNQEQLLSISQLVKYLHNLMNLTAQQGTAVESLRAQLAEANEKINKLSADMSDRKTGYRHNQLEELRNLQENISREKAEWEKEKSREERFLDQRREQLEDERRRLEKREADIRAKKDELQRQRETLQRQIDLMKEQNINVPSPFFSTPTEGVSSPSSERETSPQQVSAADKQRELAHRRSASAEFFNPPQDFDLVPHQRESSQPVDLSSSISSNNRQPRLSVGNLHNVNAPAASKQNLPMHLLSAKNEQKTQGVKVQQLPLKLSASGSQIGSSIPPPSNQQQHQQHHQQHHQQQHQQQQHQQQHQQQQQQPHRVSSTGSLSSVASNAAQSPNNMSGTPAQSRSGSSLRRSSPTRTAPGLSNLMKLAEPNSGGKRRSPSQAAPGQQQSPPNSQRNPSGPQKPSKPGDVYYF